MGGRSRVGETAYGYAVELTIARHFGKSGLHKAKYADESTLLRERNKLMTPDAKKIPVHLYIPHWQYRKPTQVGGMRILRCL